MYDTLISSIQKGFLNISFSEEDANIEAYEVLSRDFLEVQNSDKTLKSISVWNNKTDEMLVLKGQVVVGSTMGGRKMACRALNDVILDNWNPSKERESFTSAWAVDLGGSFTFAESLAKANYVNSDEFHSESARCKESWIEENIMKFGGEVQMAQTLGAIWEKLQYIDMMYGRKNYLKNFFNTQQEAEEFCVTGRCNFLDDSEPKERVGARKAIRVLRARRSTNK